MKQKEMSHVLKALTVLSVFACLVLMVVVLPFLAVHYVGDPADTYLYWPFLLISWSGFLPILVISAIAWGLFREIGQDNSFCEKNAQRLRLISYLAVVGVAIWLAGVAFIVLTGVPAMGIIVAFLMAMTIMLVLAITSTCLSHLTAKAAALKLEQDLTV